MVQKYNTEAERKNAIKNTKTKYMLNKPFYCQYCDPTHNYTLAGKWTHFKSRKHIINVVKKAIESVDESDVITVNESDAISH